MRNNKKDHGIRVNAVSPGMIDTPMADIVTGGHREMLKEMVKAVPMGKLGTSEDNADAVLWLCSDGSKYITWQIVSIDGGFLAQ